MTRFSLRPTLFVLGVALALSACDASLDSEDTDLTNAEVADAAQIVADALAEDTGGLVASARDLTASVTDEAITDGPRGIRGHRDDRPHDHPPCRGEHSLTYDAATGTHVVAYACTSENDRMQKAYAARLTYQYRDADGGFVARPVENWDTVDSVAFGGVREGTFSRFRGDFSSASAFEQRGDWTLSQLADDAAPALLSGSQVRTGSRERSGPEGSASRDFSVEVSGNGIEIREGEDGLGYAVVGELNYLLTMEIVRNGQTRTRTVEGTVQLEANGRALLRIMGIRGVYRVSLGDGETDLEA